MVCVCCVEEKKTLAKMINTMQNMTKNVYFGDQHSSEVGGGGLNVERLTTGCNITGGCRMKKKKPMC